MRKFGPKFGSITISQVMVYKLKEVKEGTCLQCGGAVYGRQDKKFCSEKCKNAYHNHQASDFRKLKNDTLSYISGNYEILDRLEKNKIRSISIDRIKELGFREGVATGHRLGRFNHLEESCFDIIYYRTPMEIFNIHRKQ